MHKLEWIKAFQTEYPQLDFTDFIEELSGFDYETEEEFKKQGVLAALSRVDNTQDISEFIGLELVGWVYVARDLLLETIHAQKESELTYPNPHAYLESLTERGFLSESIIESYNIAELKEAYSYIDESRNLLFDYAGLRSLSDRYLLRDFDGRLLEGPQQRFMHIALYLMQKEDPASRMQYVKELYDVLSKLELTVATPTLANAGKPNAQLASCQIVTTDDSLRSIYDDNTDVASFSKFGAGLGVYIGKLRAEASDIRGHKGVSSGVIPWVKNLDNTAVAVNQLGVRQGAIAVFLDIWHADIFDFIDLRLNTGDHSKRAHNIFPGLCTPDIFWTRVENRENFSLFDPHEVQKFLGTGKGLEDYYDKVKYDYVEPLDKEKHAFTYYYLQCEQALLEGKIRGRTVAAIDLMKAIMKASIETGVPYIMHRDTVNRMNANPHAGMIYSSNLCTEILQNQSPTVVTSEETIYETGEVRITKKAGDLVTCNLSSVVLNRIFKNAKGQYADYIARVIRIQVRALDAVVDLNNIPVPAASITNRKYRAIGAGQQGIAALLAYMGIAWDSEEAVNFIGELQEKIHYLTIDASVELAKEKGAYPAYEGSDWQTGEYFEKRGLSKDSLWGSLIEKVSKYGIRNSYLLATAPTGSTGIIAGSTPSVDPVFNYVYSEKKNDFVIPVVVPDLNFDTLPYYKPTSNMSYDGETDLAHMWAILHNEARGKHIDQASSFNLYIPDDIKAKNLLRLHLEMWKRGIKTIYYTRSKTRPLDVEDCVSCSA